MRSRIQGGMVQPSPELELRGAVKLYRTIAEVTSTFRANIPVRETVLWPLAHHREYYII